MSDVARLRSDLRTFSLAIEQHLGEWLANSLALDHRTTVLVAPRQSGKPSARGSPGGGHRGGTPRSRT